MAAEGAGNGATANKRDRSMDCIKRNTTGRKLLQQKGYGLWNRYQTKCGRLCLKKAPADGTGVMQYQWNDRESVGMTEMLMPRNYLEIPEPRIPGVFLELAEETRNVILVDGQSCDTEEVQPQRTGLTRPV